jgi:hypothetical protein
MTWNINKHIFWHIIANKETSLTPLQNFTIDFPCLTIHGNKKQNELSISQTSFSRTLIHIFKLQLFSHNKFWYSFHVAHYQ